MRLTALFASLLLVAGPALAEPIFPAGTPPEELWNSGEFTEGVAAGPDGKIYFSDIGIAGTRAGTIVRFDPATGKSSVFVEDSGQSNGLFFDKEGRLIAACGANHGHRALVTFAADGSMTPLTNRYDGKRFNAPNDLVIHPKGWIYFSDPRYVGFEPLELDVQAVYRANSEGDVVLATKVASKPNGLIISPDGKTLYVAETDNGATGVEPEGTAPGPVKMNLKAVAIDPETGDLGEAKTIVSFGEKLGIDGMTMDTQGRIYAAVRSDDRHGIAVYSPEGKELDFLKMDVLPTNCTFSLKPDRSTLYITAGSGLYRIKTSATGYHPFAAK